MQNAQRALLERLALSDWRTFEALCESCRLLVSEPTTGLDVWTNIDPNEHDHFYWDSELGQYWRIDIDTIIRTELSNTALKIHAFMHDLFVSPYPSAGNISIWKHQIRKRS